MSLLNSVNKRTFSHWLAPSIGTLIGIIYAITDEWVYQTGEVATSKTPNIVVIVHDSIDLVLPVILGFLIGFGINVFRRQFRMNRQLSIQNTQFQRDLLISTLISQFLHEVRNPIHNIVAVLEENKNGFSKEDEEIVQRNLKTFENITSQYKNWSSLFHNFNANEPVNFRVWFKEFVEDKLQNKISGLDVGFLEEIEPITVHMHPLLLEQSFVILFSNAFEELIKWHWGRRQLSFSAHLITTENKNEVEFKLKNSSKGFPDHVLENQGRAPVVSHYGTGVGFFLLRKMIEQVGGQMKLANTETGAETTLIVSGEKL